MEINLTEGKKVFFASDLHLGVPNKTESLLREKKFVRWLDYIKAEAEVLFILGDLFDFWFEYKNVVPKGFTRILGKIAELSDLGIEVIFFTGNHDMWMFGYFEAELNIKIIRQPKAFTISQKRFYIAHGDGLGPGDKGFKLLKKIFTNRLCQKAFAAMPPAWGFFLAQYFSGKSREVNQIKDIHFLGEDKEWLIIHSKEVLAKTHFDYFIYGHRHLPMKLSLTDNSAYVNLGDWIANFSYAVWDGKEIELKVFTEAS
jgi:UDP-2,3-diacylglucosamine hydrolase